MNLHSVASGSSKHRVEPLKLQGAPTLMERVWPAQKISVETKREFDAHGAQTLTPLGSYWKGRKRLIYVRACLLGALLPASDNAELDLSIFEKLMAIDDHAFLFRDVSTKPSEIARLLVESGSMAVENLSQFFKKRNSTGLNEAVPHPSVSSSLAWNCTEEDKRRLRLTALAQLSYQEKVDRCLRPEELGPEYYQSISDDVNAHLGTSASCLPELVEQLGIMRFGRKPKVADIFCGAGSIPFEAARIGCDAYASDLNPVACMLTWGSVNLIGGTEELRKKVQTAQLRVSAAVEERISCSGFETDANGNRAKAFLYCLEVECPSSGWVIPLLPSFVISRIKRTIVALRPNNAEKRFDLELMTDVSDDDLSAAKKGTVQDGFLIYSLHDNFHKIPISSIRGDVRRQGVGTTNSLRQWERHDIAPREGDILGERLYCVQWIKAETLGRGRQETFFASPTSADLVRESSVRQLVESNLSEWQNAGILPDMEIEPGEKTDELIRTRGWRYWHQLFTPRQLLISAYLADEICKIDDGDVRACLSFVRANIANFSSKLSRWLPGTPGKPGRAAAADQVKDTFYNQSLAPFANYATRSFHWIRSSLALEYRPSPIAGSAVIQNGEARNIGEYCDLFITDPPYADAVNYEEISEFFIAWLRKNSPAPFSQWKWDSRRQIAIKGDGEEFRRAMISAYSAAAKAMPDDGLQIVMFTHTSGSVWADMAQIFWGAGLRVISAWYVATETTSDTKKGGYVQGTVTIVLRKRMESESGYKDEIVQEVRAEVADQIDTMVGLNQSLKGHGRIENLFEDADLQMAGYAAALRVLTRYQRIDGTDMAKEALRVRRPGEKDLVGEVIDFAVQVANEHMVPEHMPPEVWERLAGPERFYFKMMDIETTSLRKLDNYQNFAKAFRVAGYDALMGSMEPNKASLKTAKQFRKSGFEIPDFGSSATRAVLYAIFELENDVDGDEVLAHLRDQVNGYHSRRDELIALADYIARKRAAVDETESRAARILFDLIRNERFG